jgi:hypothetical protein
MSRVPDEDVEDAAPPATEPAGKVEVDSRGNSVWRWARDVLESTSVLLKRLENKDLALEPTQKVPVMGGPAPASKKAAKPPEGSTGREPPQDKRPQHPALQRERKPRETGGGFDPYNSR